MNVTDFWNSPPYDTMSLLAWHIFVVVTALAFGYIACAMLYFRLTKDLRPEFLLGHVMEPEWLRAWGQELDENYPDSSRADEYQAYTQARRDHGLDA